MLEVVKVLRYCRRCARWRSIGNFTHSRWHGRSFVSKNCRRCQKAGVPRLSGARFWVLTNKGRRALRKKEVA